MCYLFHPVLRKQALHEWAPYCVSKAALKMLTLCFQTEIKDIAFTDVQPGVVDTPMMQHILENQFKGLEHLKKIAAAQRFISPNIVGQFLMWLLTQTDVTEYRRKSWDIYETWHHSYWLQSGKVPHL